METFKEGKRLVEIPLSDEEVEEEDSKKIRPMTPSAKKAGGSSQISCVVENCTTNMADAKQYYRRHKVCAFHAKAAAVLLGGSQKRFCQQCSRFHDLSEFDEAKRSCRRRLAGHNERRRKSSYDSH